MVQIEVPIQLKGKERKLQEKKKNATIPFGAHHCRKSVPE